MQIVKNSTEKNDINNYVFTSDDTGKGTWKYNAVTLQNKVSSYNVELSTKSLFDPESRFTVTSTIRNELNLTLSPLLSPYFSINPVPIGIYALIFNFEITNGNSIEAFYFSTTSETIPMNSSTSYITITGKKLSTSFIVNLNKTDTTKNYIYLSLMPRSQNLFGNWTNFTYWDKPWSGLTSGENFLIKGTIDIIKLA